MDRANEERLAEIEFVCAGCGEVCLICDLETDVALTHCTECANKRIRELVALDLRRNKRTRQLEDLLTIGYDLVAESIADSRQYDYAARAEVFVRSAQEALADD